jgi:hypothetical protein
VPGVPALLREAHLEYCCAAIPLQKRSRSHNPGTLSNNRFEAGVPDPGISICTWDSGFELIHPYA